jgi:hypothetical protein
MAMSSWSAQRRDAQLRICQQTTHFSGMREIWLTLHNENKIKLMRAWVWQITAGDRNSSEYDQ